MAEGLSLAGPPQGRRRAAFHTAALLPTDTSVRYATLLSLAIATTSVIYLRFFLDRFDMASRYQQCTSQLVRLSLWRPQSGSGQLWNFQFGQAKACLRPYAVSALSTALLGVAALVLLAWAHYVLHPRWRIARRRLVALGPHGPAELMSFLDGLVTAAGLTRPPKFWIALHRSKAQAVAFGTSRSNHIQLNASLLGLFYDESKRDRFAAVVLHELAHVRNRDIGYTYATIAVWRAFLIVSVLPFLALRVLPTVIGQPGGWAIAPMTLKAFQPQAAWSMAALAILVFLTYYSVLRTRETQADITAAAIGGPDALDQHLQHGRSGGWTLLQRHPQPHSRRSTLASPLQQRWGQLSMVFFAGIAIASLQHNLNGLLMPAYLVLSKGRAADAADAPVVALVSSINLLGAALIVTLACTLTWRARLLNPQARLPARRLIGWSAAATLGLLLGEPLALFHAGGGSWGFLTIAGDRALPAAAVATGSLILLLTLVFGWAHEAAVVWLPVVRSGMRRVFLAATLAGALGFAVPYIAWMGFRGSPFSLLLYDWRPALGPWELSWHPPLERLVFSEYFPVFVMSLLPGSRLLLVVPLFFVLAGALRRSPEDRPKWLLATDLVLPRRGRLRVRRAVLAGLGGAAVCLLAGIALALLVWDSGGRQLDDDIPGAGTYLLFACTALAIAAAMVVAGYVVWTERVAAATLALGAALVTTMTMAVLSVFPTAIAMCGPDDAAFCVGHYWRQLSAMSLAVPNMLAVPRTLVATCLAITIVMTVRHIVTVSRRST